MNWIRKYKIGSYLIRNWIVLLITMLGFTTYILSGYSVYALFILPFIFIFTLKITLNEIALPVLYGGLFAVSTIINFGISPSAIAQYAILPVSGFLIGKYFTDKASNIWQVLTVILLIILCMAIMPIVQSIQDFISTGELISTNRVLNQFDEDETYKATILNTYVSLAIGGIGIVFIRANNRMTNVLKWYIFALSILSLFVSLRLLNRTPIVLAALSLFVAMLLSINTKGGKVRVLLVGLALIICALYFLRDSLFVTDLVDSLMNREKSEAGKISTGGGRTIRWIAAIKQIISNPMGAKALVLDGGIKTAAHNTWLDIGVIGGWFPFVLFIVMTVQFIKQTMILRKGPLPFFFKSYMILLVVTLFLQLAVEPTIHGEIQFFTMFFVLWGFVKELNEKVYIKSHLNRKNSNGLKLKKIS